VSDKSIAQGLVPWNAVLIDGSVIKTEMNEDTRKQLIKNHNIPVLHPTTGLQLGWLEASILAALIVNGLSGLTSTAKESLTSLRNRRKEKQPALTDNDKRRYAMHETARLLVASVLGVEPPVPLTIENIEAQMGLTTPNKNLNPITLSKYKKNMAMYLAGPALEDKIYPSDPSVFSSGALEAVSVMARVLVTKLGMGPVYNKYIPDAIIPDSNKQKLQDEALKFFDEAYAQAKSVIEQHADRIEELQRANRTVKKITRKEVLTILDGKTTEDIVQDRRWLVRLRRRLTA
jgi:hypothetical protein